MYDVRLNIWDYIVNNIVSTSKNAKEWKKSQKSLENSLKILGALKTAKNKIYFIKRKIWNKILFKTVKKTVTEREKTPKSILRKGKKS